MKNIPKSCKSNDFQSHMLPTFGPILLIDYHNTYPWIFQNSLQALCDIYDFIAALCDLSY